MRRCLLLSALALAGLGACSGHTAPPPATPAPVVRAAPTPPPDPSAALLGHWTYTASLGEEQYTGTLDISRDTAGWHAKVVDQVQGEALVKTVAVEGNVMTVELEAGAPVTVKLTPQADGTLAGKVAVAAEGEGTITAKRN